ncbi:MAG: hypothetical protein LCH38_12870 [Proteobacteria bacterium]|nr:hypothetical protein [Pseudomonadota bacterium]
MNSPAEGKGDGIRLTEEEKARQAKRNRAIALAIAGLCLLFYVITVFKMGSAILNRPL